VRPVTGVLIAVGEGHRAVAMTQRRRHRAVISRAIGVDEGRLAAVEESVLARARVSAGAKVRARVAGCVERVGRASTVAQVFDVGRIVGDAAVKEESLASVGGTSIGQWTG
jgi:hypothetical protein